MCTGMLKGSHWLFHFTSAITDSYSLVVTIGFSGMSSSTCYVAGHRVKPIIQISLLHRDNPTWIMRQWGVMLPGLSHIVPAAGFGWEPTLGLQGLQSSANHSNRLASWGVLMYSKAPRPLGRSRSFWKGWKIYWGWGSSEGLSLWQSLYPFQANFLDLPSTTMIWEGLQTIS